MVQVKQPRRSVDEVLADAAERARRLSRLGLVPTDQVRFLKPNRTNTWLYATPHDIHADGSVSCFANNHFRSIPPARLEVKRRGPRGGIHWVPLTTPEEAP